jgi:hypothetical protein
MNEELTVFRRVDFGSVRLLREVWLDSSESDVRLQDDVISRFDDSLDRLRSLRKNQLGLVLTGAAGSGKTHTFGQIRRKAMASGAHFILIDCTDILHFWSTLALQYLQSLQQEYVDQHGVTRTQIETILSDLVYKTYSRRPAHILSEMSNMDRHRLIQIAGDVVAHLRLSHTTRMQRRHGTVRALFYLYSGEQSLSDLAYAYLQGQKLESTSEQDSTVEVNAIYLGGENSPKDVVSDLAWLMSLTQLTVLAFDQLDPIVTQHRVLAADENHESQAIIQGVVNGFMSLMDTLEQTLPVVAGLEVSWETLRKWGLNSAIDRFQLPPVALGAPRTAESYEQIVRQRLDRSYRSQSFAPPYPTWPITAKFFDTLQGLSPREVLNRCERHRQACLAAGAVSELAAYSGDVADLPRPTVRPGSLDAAFSQLKQAASIEMPNEENEDEFGRQLADVCEMFLKELPSDPDIDWQCEHEFRETKKYASLHVRLRRIFRKQSDREEHVCIRVLEKGHWKAFQVRLAAARTMSGVTEGLAGRTLVLLRNGPAPGGSTTQKLIDEFRRAGGRIEPVNRTDLGVFSAVQQLQREFRDDFEVWLRHARPLSQTALFQNLVPTWLEQEAIAVAAAATDQQKPVRVQIEETRPPAEAVPVSAVANIRVGLRDGSTSQPIEFPIIDLTRHVVIRAGSGGGKTVLLKRLVEEAALAGVSSIVIDSARDLSYLGDQWPEKPEGWLEKDDARADRYLREVKVLIWTPGRRDGRPMFLSPLPDFRSDFAEQAEFEHAVQIATDSLGGLLVTGRNRTRALAVLQAAMTHFARQQGHDLQAFGELLQELPESATPNISRARKLAQEMGDQLNALILRDPMLSTTGQPIDIGELFGATGGPPTVSVISLFALNDLSSQAAFIGRLAMAVFDWIRRNPARDGLRGLFVVDEAAPFLPRSSSESKDALMLLCQQARKYGVGLLLATQNPMDLDYNATAQFATQFFGTANQPQVVRFIEGVMEQRGLRNLNPSGLKPGWFYVSAPSLKQPIKLQAPMCLSWHPRNRTPTDEEILGRVHRRGR